MKDIAKNILLAMLFSFCFINIGNSQVSFGGGITYLNEAGVQTRSVIELEKFNIIPKFSFYIVDDRNSYSFEVDAAYNVVSFADENPLYLFSGLALYRSSKSGISNSDFGFNFGVGLQISQIYGELKYTTLFCDECNGQIGFSVGYMF